MRHRRVFIPISFGLSKVRVDVRCAIYQDDFRVIHTLFGMSLPQYSRGDECFSGRYSSMRSRSHHRPLLQRYSLIKNRLGASRLEFQPRGLTIQFNSRILYVPILLCRLRFQNACNCHVPSQTRYVGQTIGFKLFQYRFANNSCQSQVKSKPFYVKVIRQSHAAMKSSFSL
jgi:hypothetical protein